MSIIPFSLQCTISENQLLALKDSENGCLNSDRVLNIPGFKYGLSVFPNGHKDTNRGEVCIGLFLELGNVKKVGAKYSMVIESADFSTEVVAGYEVSSGVLKLVCKTEDFFKPEKKFIVDGKFTLKLNGNFFIPNGDASISNVEQQKWDGGEMGNELWEENDCKDFTIFADGKEIKVHKLFLCTRSAVFKAMLNPKTKESIIKKVEIPDFSFKVVETAVKMIYNCDFASSLSHVEMTSLLCFFDKYQIPLLKEKVELLLINQISVTTVCYLANVSVLLNSIQLKNKCMEFLEKSFASKTPLSDIQTLDKDIAVQILQNMVCHTVKIE